MITRVLQIGLAVSLGLATAGCTSSTRDAPASPTPNLPPDVPASSTPDVASDTTFASEEDYAAQRDAAVSDLEAAVSTRATSADACSVIMYGEQACGGATDWVVLSTETSDADRVRQLAARVTGLDARANAQFEFVSTCMALVPPPVELQAGECATASP